MELESLFGLPAHPLLVHAAVVIAPLAGLFAVVLGLVPRWRLRYRWKLLIIATAGCVSVFLAAGSGEALEERVDRSAALRRHSELGDATMSRCFALFVIALFFAFKPHFGARPAASDSADSGSTTTATPKRWLAFIAPVLLIASGAIAATSVIAAGHQGAKVTWADLEGDVDHDDESEDQEDEDEDDDDDDD